MSKESLKVQKLQSSRVPEIQSSNVQKVEFESRFVSCSVNPLRFDEEKCIGCNRCAAVCQVDILVPSPEKGKHPIVLYPGECYYCGSCVMACNSDAIKLVHPLMNQTKFVPVAE